MPDAVKTEVGITRERHLKFFHLYRRTDGIVKVLTAESAFITIREAKEFVAAIKEITDGVPYLFLFIPGRHYTIDKEARTYMASKDALQFTVALAVIVRTFAHRIMGNLFVTVDRPQKPVRHFENEDDAIVWLKKQNT